MAREFVCWQPVLTVHQAYTLVALGRAAKSAVFVYSLYRTDWTRAAQGWTEPAIDGLELRLVPQSGGFAEIRRIMDRHAQAVHIFGSPFDRMKFMYALALAASMGREVYLLSEPYSPIAAGYFTDRAWLWRAIKARLRPLLYRSFGALLKRRIRGVFAISPLAVRQFRTIGIPTRRVYPFGYFVPREPDTARRHRDVSPPAGLSAVFVGALIERKGVVDLERAVALLAARGINVTADIYGPGDSGILSPVDGRVRYKGIIPFGGTQAIVADYDVMVLPSRYDGWGVVVNEAIQAGVPVICSDKVGAGALVLKWGCGCVYPARDVNALASALERLAASAELQARMRAACLEARETLEPNVAGRYMQTVFDAESRGAALPACPWYDS